MNAAELLDLLRIKPHTLRYWEQVLPLVRGRHDDAGHRVWSTAQTRLLLRIRHLVVERGMSVEGAGNAVIAAASPDTAQVRAAIEACRAELVELLRCSGRGSEAGRSEPPVRTTQPSESGPSIDLRGLVETRAAAARFGETGARGGARRDAGRHPVQRDDGTPSDEPCVALAWAHMASPETPSCRNLAYRLIAHREGELDQRPLILVPDAERAACLAAIGAGPDREAERAGEERIVSVLPVRAGEYAYQSATIGLLHTVGAARAVDRALDHRRARVVWVWPYDDPHAPRAPSLALVAAAERSPVGIALESAGGDGRGRFTGGMVLIPERVRFARNDLLAAGRWRPALDTGDGTADRGKYRWRYDLWLRDLWDAGAIVVHRAQPFYGPWTGASWCEEVEALWPDIAER